MTSPRRCPNRHRNHQLPIILIAAAATLIASLISTTSYAKAKATVTIVEGKAWIQPPQIKAWKALKQGAHVIVGASVKTGKNGRLELTLPDKSVLRLGPNSKFAIQSFKKGGKRSKRRLTAKLVVGKLWAAISKIAGVKTDIKVKTPHAVAGVRGTRFNTVARKRGTTVKVYDGRVLVSNRPTYAIKGHTKKRRRQVAGPQEISKQQWTEMVAGAMQVVRVSAKGKMQPPSPFELSTPGKNLWEAWNLEQDKRWQQQTP